MLNNLSGGRLYRISVVALVALIGANLSACGRRRGTGVHVLVDAGGSDSSVGTDFGTIEFGVTDLGTTDMGVRDSGLPVTDLGTDLGARCGNRVIDPSETCDGTNLNGETCVTLGYASGTLACNLTCSNFSTVGCVEAATHAPTITSFTASPTSLSPSSPVTFTAVANDVDGLSDLASAELRDMESGYSYGSLTRSGGTFTGSFSWDTIDAYVPINFTTPTARVFEVVVADFEGYEATRTVSVTLTCVTTGYGACDGICTNLNTTTDCGSCARACPAGCSAGTCACPSGTTDCHGECLAHTSGSCASPLNGDLGTDAGGGLYVYYSGSWQGICDDGFGSVDATVACTQFGTTVSTYSTSYYGPRSTFWLDDVSCGGSETRIDACSHTTWGTHNCSYSEWVNLTCAW